jgi:hypothetical protein
VRFRIAYGSSGTSSSELEGHHGFAFDNFSITQRTRFSVLEYFTNANPAATVASDTLVEWIRKKMSSDVIDVQYHTSYPSADRINTENPIVSSTRGLFYGNTSVPYALLDGGPYDQFLEAERKYDFHNRFPSLQDVHSRSLTAPDFRINVSVTQLAPVMQLQVDLTPLKSMSAREMTLYTLVIEDTIDNPDYIGSNGRETFRNVARKILPDAGGTNFNEPWTQGVTKTVPLAWSQIDSWIDLSRISIVAFLQDDNTKEILQAFTTQQYDPATGIWDPGLLTGRKILLYPNPAGEQVNVYFGERPQEDLKLMIYNVSGRLVLTEQVPADQMVQSVGLSRLGDGLYILELRTERNGSLYYRTKFFHY